MNYQKFYTKINKKEEIKNLLMAFTPINISIIMKKGLKQKMIYMSKIKTHQKGAI